MNLSLADTRYYHNVKLTCILLYRCDYMNHAVLWMLSVPQTSGSIYAIKWKINSRGG